jgi:hypothetical protein
VGSWQRVSTVFATRDGVIPLGEIVPPLSVETAESIDGVSCRRALSIRSLRVVSQLDGVLSTEGDLACCLLAMIGRRRITTW